MKKLFAYEPIVFIFLIWFFYLAGFVVPNLNYLLGIQPRSLEGLWGILGSPFAHKNAYHLMANSLPLLIMGTLLRLQGRAVYWWATATIIVLGGLGTWLISSPATVIGASGLVFGYWAFLIVYGIKCRSLKAMGIAVVVCIFYGSLFFSLFYTAPGISWAGHFCGALAGVVSAWFWVPKRVQ